MGNIYFHNNDNLMVVEMMCIFCMQAVAERNYRSVKIYTKYFGKINLFKRCLEWIFDKYLVNAVGTHTGLSVPKTDHS